jgi:putative N6-adenine-specific DNA methylase
MFDNINNNTLKRRIKRHVIGDEHVFLSIVQPGFEKRAGDELSDIGLNNRNNFIEGGVEFSGKLDSCFMASFLSRTVNRIIMRIGEFRTVNYYELERKIRSFPWELYISQECKILFRSSSSKSKIYHTGKLEEIFINGINERLIKYNVISNSEDHKYSQTIFLRNNKDICTVSLDASGEFLYKRGIRKNINKAPIRETTASLILLESNIENYDLIIDPMCGSGTFSIEAASIFTKTPPGLKKEFTFMHWPSFKNKSFNNIKKNLIKDIIPQEKIKQEIITSDIDSKEVETAKLNIPEELNKIITPKIADFFSLPNDIAKNKKTLIVLNPPYGKRINSQNIKSIYTEIGKKIRNDFKNCGYAIILPDYEKENSLNLKYDKKIAFMNGGIKVKILFKDI